jgi:peptidoglycan hydrolase-like protein with peptidoglycan-binding domain
MNPRTAMKTWMTALALTVAGTMLTTSAFAQTGAASSPTSTGTDVKSGTDTKSGTAPAVSPSTSPGASGSTTGSTGSDMKSGAMDKKSDTTGNDAKSGAVKSSGSEPTTKDAGNLEQVKAVQQALKDKGQNPGDVDGRMGPKTEAALRDFQQKQGLKATGHADAETIAKLGVEAKAGAVSGPSSSPAVSPSGVSPSGTSSTTPDAAESKDAKSKGAKQTK